MNIAGLWSNKLATRLLGAVQFDATHALYQRLAADLELARSDSTLAVLIVSLARSDLVGATLGLPESAAISTELLARVAVALHATDYVALTNADELWIVLPALASATIASLAATNIARALEGALLSGALTVTLRTRIGIAVAPSSGGTAIGLLQAASEANKRARSQNLLYCVATDTDGTGLHNKDLIVALASALALNQLTIAYQPKVDVVLKKVVSVEALIRWPVDLQPAMSPMTLVEIAEQFGMIEDLTRHVLHTVLREQSMMLAEAGIQRIWINLSAGMLADPGLPDFLQQALDIWSASASTIGLEITESAVINDIEQSITMMHSLSQRGFEMAIDDFGTGYSSLAYLRRFPISELKIDQMFVRHMNNSEPDTQIVRTIIDLAHNFKLKVVAEGVEDAPTLTLLAQMGCDQIQGYVYAKPMPAKALVQWLANFSGALSMD
ncbi:EAL domain-containing protein [Actimicrobium antarcticum]|uniref:EAL domain-containing protein n=1 Tax=Actimicrobium antarcticum TaxID=1051899 RepID=A0ABP7SW38_9BURK